jgi:hypothetical protein
VWQTEQELRCALLENTQNSSKEGNYTRTLDLGDVLSRKKEKKKKKKTHKLSGKILISVAMSHIYEIGLEC